MGAITKTRFGALLCTLLIQISTPLVATMLVCGFGPFPRSVCWALLAASFPVVQEHLPGALTAADWLWVWVTVWQRLRASGSFLVSKSTKPATSTHSRLLMRRRTPAN